MWDFLREKRVVEYRTPPDRRGNIFGYFRESKPKLLSSRDQL